MVKQLSGMCKALGSIPSPEKRETNPADEKEGQEDQEFRAVLSNIFIRD